MALNARYYARNGKRLLKTRRRKGIAPILNSDPTVFYANDTMSLADLAFDEWQK